MGKQPSQTPPHIVILGAGLAGLGAASRLADHDAVIYEKRSHSGGHASSHQVQGFTFDEGPHISFTKDERVRKLFADSVGGRFLERPAVALNYFQGQLFKHPGLFHLYPLPVEIKKACLVDLVAAQSASGPVETYRDWCCRQYGKSFTDIFVRRYTRKYWTVELEELTTDWVGPRVPAPSLTQAIEGALVDSPNNYNYISMFRYPEQGGFAAFCRGLIAGKTIHTGCDVQEIDPETRVLVLANGGQREAYDWLISSIPLPDLVGALPAAPAEIRDAARCLRYTSHFMVSVGIRGTHTHEADWIYFYDEEIPFARVSVPSRLAPSNAPKGHYSLQAEVVHSASRPLGDPRSVTERTLAWLGKIGLIRDPADITLVHTQDIQYANIIFTKERDPAVARIHAYLRTHGIIPCGRYGAWAYLWTDESYVSGEQAAEEVRGRIAAGVGVSP